jgi:tetratricopeptide (TPR) repeat protein
VALVQDAPNTRPWPPGCRARYEEAHALTRAVLLRGPAAEPVSYEGQPSDAALPCDPYAGPLLPVHVASAVALCGWAGVAGGGGAELRSELFLLGHRLMEEQPDSAGAGRGAAEASAVTQSSGRAAPCAPPHPAPPPPWALPGAHSSFPPFPVSWYAVGAYYLAARQPDAARRHLARATQLQRAFAPAWLAYGHAFAALDERDQARARGAAGRAAARWCLREGGAASPGAPGCAPQALSAYRTAARLFPGLHTPHLSLGAEYCAAANLPAAERSLLAAYDLCPHDPHLHHELGVLLGRCGQPAAAAMWLDRALSLMPAGPGGRPTARERRAVWRRGRGTST